jgi:hypothetical protein
LIAWALRGNSAHPSVTAVSGRLLVAYFFFVFFAAFGFAAAFVVGFFALRFAVIGMSKCSLLQGSGERTSRPQAPTYWAKSARDATAGAAAHEMRNARSQGNTEKINTSCNHPYTELTPARDPREDLSTTDSDESPANRSDESDAY